MIFQKKSKDTSLFTGGMKIPQTAHDTIPFWEVYENGLFLVGKDRYTLIFAFENLDYALLREVEQRETYESYQTLLNALPTDINYQEFIMNSSINSEKLRKTMIPEKSEKYPELYDDYCNILEENIAKSEQACANKIMLIALSYQPQTKVDNVNVLFKYYINKVTNSAIVLDRTNEMNSNGFVLGPSGSGKSLFVKLELTDMTFKYPDDEVIIIDPDNEYGALITEENFDGEKLTLSPNSSTKYKIFDIDLSYTEEGKDAVAVKAELILTVVETMKGTPLSSEEKSILDRCIHQAYYDFRMSGGKDTSKIPTLTTLYDLLKTQTEAEASQLALIMELYVKGSLKNFADKTNINIHKKLLIIDIFDMGEQLRAVGLQIVLEFVWQRVIANKKRGIRTWLICDEFSIMFNDGNDSGTSQSGKFFMKVFSRIRKHGGVATEITQNIIDVLNSPAARSMLSNAEFKILLQQNPDNLIEISKLFELSPSQEAFLKTGEVGTGLIICGKKVIPFDKRIKQNGRIYEMISTNFEEIRKDKI